MCIYVHAYIHYIYIYIYNIYIYTYNIYTHIYILLYTHIDIEIILLYVKRVFRPRGLHDHPDNVIHWDFPPPAGDVGV